MPVGQPYRQATADSLRGTAAIEPAATPVPSLPAVSTDVQDLNNSMASQLAESISGFASEKVQEIVNTEHEKSFLDGQIAFAQDESWDNLEIEGDKWSMQGYRVTEAASISASMLSAQQELVRQSDYADDPDAYRAKLVGRLEAQITGLDPRTARMVREQFSEQIPTLVAQHTTENIKFQESESYRTLVGSIDILSRDESKIKLLTDTVTGVDGATGLSRDRRQSAVAQGIVGAFNNGNPQAYGMLKESGAFDDFSTGQLQLMENAKRNYQVKLRKEVDVAYIEERGLLTTQIEAGEFSDQEGLKEVSDLMLRYGMEITAGEAGVAFNKAGDAHKAASEGNSFLIKAAAKRQDWKQVASLTRDILGDVESGNNPDATGPEIKFGANKGDRAIGEHQVMPKTMRDPGFGIKPGDPANPDDVRRVSFDLWEVMVAGKAAGYGLTWEPGDMEAAAIGYNAGHVNAKAWIAAGRDYAAVADRKQTEPYAKSILEKIAKSGAAPDAKAMRATSKRMYDRVAKLVDMEAQERISVDRSENTAQYKAGKIDTATFISRDRALNVEHDLTRTAAESRAMVTTLNRVRAASDKLNTADLNEKLTATYNTNMSVLDGILNDDTIPLATKRTAIEGFEVAARKMYADNNIAISDSNEAKMAASIGRKWNASVKQARKSDLDTGLRDRAGADGAVYDLDEKNITRFFADQRENTAADVAALVADKNLSPEEHFAELEDATTTAWRNAGMVDPLVARGNSSLINGVLIASKDGKPSPAAVATITKYADLKELYPYLSNSFFSDPKAQERADAVLAYGAGDAVEGILNMEMPLAGNDRRNKLSDDELKAMAVAGAMAVTYDADVGIVQGLFQKSISSWLYTTTAEVEARQRAARDYIVPLMENEIATLRIRMDAPPEVLAKVAAENLERKVSVLGDSVVVYPRGKNFLRQALGSKADLYAEEDGLEDEMLVDWLAVHAQDITGLDRITQFTHTEIGLFDRMLRSSVNTVTDAAGFGDVMDPVSMGLADALNARLKGVRPYSVFVVQGKTFLRYLKEDGEQSAAYQLDPKAIGDFFLSKREADNKD